MSDVRKKGSAEKKGSGVFSDSAKTPDPFFSFA